MRAMGIAPASANPASVTAHGGMGIFPAASNITAIGAMRTVGIASTCAYALAIAAGCGMRIFAATSNVGSISAVRTVGIKAARADAAAVCAVGRMGIVTAAFHPGRADLTAMSISRDAVLLRPRLEIIEICLCLGFGSSFRFFCGFGCCLTGSRRRVTGAIGRGNCLSRLAFCCLVRSGRAAAGQDQRKKPACISPRKAH